MKKYFIVRSVWVFLQILPSHSDPSVEANIEAGLALRTVKAVEALIFEHFVTGPWSLHAVEIVLNYFHFLNLNEIKTLKPKENTI